MAGLCVARSARLYALGLVVLVSELYQSSAQTYVCDVRQQAAAMQALWTELDGKNWQQDERPWSNTTSYCNWAGVYCCFQRFIWPYIEDRQFITNGSWNCTAGAVWGIDLEAVPGLQGTLPIAALSKLNCSLAVLRFVNNPLLVGTLPLGLTALTRLKVLRLPDNGFTGKMPDVFDGLSQLVTFDVANNFLTGRVLPNMCGNTSRFSYLSIISASFNMLTGPFEMSYCESLQELYLQGNRLNGSVPNLPGCHNLTQLYLANNRFTGSIADEFFDDVPALQTLDLAHNLLTGTVPNMCDSPEQSSELVDVSFAFNQLSGQLHNLSCANLVLLGLENNQLSGTLPDLRGCSRLHILRIPRNALQGTLADSIGYDSADMSSFILNGNQLRGSIPSSISSMDLLIGLNLANNKLTGTIPEKITQLGTLANVVLDKNFLNGTLPQNIGFIASLTSFTVSNNYLTGTIPSSMSRLVMSSFTEYPCVFNSTLTNMSCCGRQRYDDYSPFYNSRNQLLPEWLGFVPYEYTKVIHRDLSNELADFTFRNILCPQIGFVEDNVVTTLNWYLDPSYYRYQGCACPPMYHMVVDANAVMGPGSGVSCIKDPTYWDQNKGWIIAVIVIVGVLLLLLLLLMTPHLIFGRPVFVRAYINMRKRVKGIPQSGLITIVVTDIEGYSDLMKQSPELMTRALNIHNGVIRKAKWLNFGHTVEQEGDSYAIAFREAVDAAAFCLMAQQALMLQDWPRDLFLNEAAEYAAKRRSGTRLLNSVNNFLSGTFPWRHKSRESGSVTSCPARFTMGTSSNHSSSPFLGNNGGAATGPMSPTASSCKGSYDMSHTHTLVSMDTPASAALTAAVAAVQAERGLDLPPARFSEVCTLEPTVTGLGNGSLADSQHQHHHAKRGGPPVLWCGVRVRMGMATGELQSGTTIRSSAIMEEAKLVSDAGSGGQLLMDERTFMMIKDRLEELGAVDHNGYNASKFNAMRPWWRLWRPRRNKCLDEAIVLDMGEYRQSATGDIPLMLGVTSFVRQTSVGVESNGTDKNDSGANNAKAMLRSIVGAPFRRRGHLARFDRDEENFKRLHLLQILSPILAGRAKIFLNKLALKPEWVMSDKPYFSAPGAFQAPISDTDPLTDVLPDVTMVFMIVDGGKQYAMVNRKDARQVHCVCAAVIRTTLRSVEGGYVCRLQDGELKYMVCFATPQAALQWCLLVQQVLMYADWPESALKFDKFRSERGEHGQLLFRGPRMKMGVCTGVPNTIVPDHLGRADYHGACINQSARFMDAGAHGGQIVCEVALAAKVFEVWSHETASISILESDDEGPARPLPVLASIPSGDHHGALSGPSGSSDDPTDNLHHQLRNGSGGGAASSLTALEPPTVMVQTLSSGGGGIGSNSIGGGGGGSMTRMGMPSRFAPRLVLDSIADHQPTPVSPKRFVPDEPAPQMAFQPRSVAALRTGKFKFKGSPEAIDMVHVVLGSLMARRFPTDPPKGKGARVAEASGIFLQGFLPMPMIEARFRERYELMASESSAATRSSLSKTVKRIRSNAPPSTSTIVPAALRAMWPRDSAATAWQMADRAKSMPGRHVKPATAIPGYPGIAPPDMTIELSEDADVAVSGPSQTAVFESAPNNAVFASAPANAFL